MGRCTALPRLVSVAAATALARELGVSDEDLATPEVRRALNQLGHVACLLRLISEQHQKRGR